MKMVIIDAEGLILGRLASKVAKLALAGEQVIILNCEKAIITGKPKMLLRKYSERLQRGNAYRGPYFQRRPDRFVKRAIRNMLPFKHHSERSRGRQALSKIKCYIGVPEQFKGAKMCSIQEASFTKLKTPNYISVGDLLANLTGKKW